MAKDKEYGNMTDSKIIENGIGRMIFIVLAFALASLIPPEHSGAIFLYLMISTIVVLGALFLVAYRKHKKELRRNNCNT